MSQKLQITSEVILQSDHVPPILMDCTSLTGIVIGTLTFPFKAPS